MKKSLLIILILSTSVSFGQDKSKSSENASKGFQLGLNASPDYCFTTMPSYFEVPKLGYTFGLNTAYQFNSFFSIDTGLHYSNKGSQTSKMDLSFEQPDPSIPNQAQYIYNYHFIDIPLKANFTVGKRRIKFFFERRIDHKYFHQRNTDQYLCLF
jgi:hypothetical protein